MVEVHPKGNRSHHHNHQQHHLYQQHQHPQQQRLSPTVKPVHSTEPQSDKLFSVSPTTQSKELCHTLIDKSKNQIDLDALKSLYSSAQQLLQSSVVSGSKLSLLACQPNAAHQTLFAPRDPNIGAILPPYQLAGLTQAASSNASSLPFTQSNHKFLTSNLAAMAAAMATNPLFPMIAPFSIPINHSNRSPTTLAIHGLGTIADASTVTAREFALAAAAATMSQTSSLNSSNDANNISTARSMPSKHNLL